MEKLKAEALLRRKYPRRKFHRGVGVLLQGHYFVASGNEIGEGGLSFETEFALSQGQQFVVSFQIPGRDFLCVRMEVRNIQKRDNKNAIYGCAFVNLTFEGRREIRGYVTGRGENE